MSGKVIPVKILNKRASVPMYVDDWDYLIMSTKKWSQDSHGYPQTNVGKSSKRKRVLAHHIVIWKPIGTQIDHIDGNPMNNRKSNLRICSHSENRCNVGKYKNNTSGFRGIFWTERLKKYQVSRSKNGKKTYLGVYRDLEEARQVRNEATKKIHGEFAKIKEYAN